LKLRDMLTYPFPLVYSLQL